MGQLSDKQKTLLNNPNIQDLIKEFDLEIETE
jgi:hypothetical protein